MRLSVSVGLFSLLLVSCHLQDTPEVVLVPALLEEDGYKKEFIYNEDNQLSQIRMTSTFTGGGTLTSVQDFFYHTNGQIKEITSDTGFKFVYTYSGDQITRTDEYIYDSWTQHHEFTYDNTGKLTERTTYQNIPEEGGIIPTFREKYQYDENDNLAELNTYIFVAGVETPQTTFISSNYNNVLNTEDKFDVNVFNPYITLHKTHPGTMITKNGSGNQVMTDTYTYQFNTAGYITKKTTETTLFNGNTGSYTTRYTFTTQ
jgi:hypothetical protein